MDPERGRPRGRGDDEQPPDQGVRKICLIGGQNEKNLLVYSEGAATIIRAQKGMRTGMYVLVNPQTGEFDGELKGIELPVQQMEVKAIISKQSIRCEMQGQSWIVVKDPRMELEIGDLVGVDMKTPVVVGKLPKPEVAENHNVERIEWSDVIGQDDAVRLLKEIAEGFTHKSMADYYNRSHPKGMMLYGPPGCGKTLLAKALATALESDGFFTMRGPEVLSKWVGDSEAAVRAIFDAGEAYFRKTGKKAVLFIDEADAVLMKRGQEGSSLIANTLVPQFLTLMDGLQTSSSFVVLATNRPDTLDPAVVREGRIDKKIKVARPNQSTAKEILKLYLGKRPLAADLNALADAGVQTLFGTVLGKVNATTELKAGHYMSGALGASMVEEAAAIAYNRDVKSGTRSGIAIEDITLAAKAIASGLVHLDHTDVVAEHGLVA